MLDCKHCLYMACRDLIKRTLTQTHTISMANVNPSPTTSLILAWPHKFNGMAGDEPPPEKDDVERADDETSTQWQTVTTSANGAVKLQITKGAQIADDIELYGVNALSTNKEGDTRISLVMSESKYR